MVASCMIQYRRFSSIRGTAWVKCALSQMISDAFVVPVAWWKPRLDEKNEATGLDEGMDG